MSAVLAVAALAAVGCTDDENDNYQGNWVKCDTHFPGTQRGGAVCFKIGEEVYVGTGYNSNELGAQTRFRDFYKFDGRAWTQVPSMPSDTLARDGGVAFAINGKGYVGLGSTGTRFLNDFWCFDPQTQTWSRVADFPRRDGIEDYQSYERRRYAVAFVIDNVAYVGSGEDIDGHAQSDFYKFDGTTWTPIANIGAQRTAASAFVYDGKGYVVCGRNGSCLYEFQRYNPATNEWKPLRHIDNRTDESYDDEYRIMAYGCSVFGLNGKFYLSTGGANGSGVRTWEYHPDDDLWFQKTNFEGNNRGFAVGFSLTFDDGKGGGVQEHGYIATGQAGVLGNTYFSDMWEFKPDEEYEDKD